MSYMPVMSSEHEQMSGLYNLMWYKAVHLFMPAGSPFREQAFFYALNYMLTGAANGCSVALHAQHNKGM